MPRDAPKWRVCVTRDEGPTGPLTTELQRYGFTPVSCPVMEQCAPGDPAGLQSAASDLERFDWVVCASQRAVRALSMARGTPWPRNVRTAAVGGQTAQALRDAGVPHPLLAAAGDGADALWATLRDADAWKGRRVLVPTTPGGRTTLAAGLRAAGAIVEEVEAYRMHEREAVAIRQDWRAADADAVVIGSPRVADALAEAVGEDALKHRPVVAIGSTTAQALDARGIPCHVPPTASFPEAARLLAVLCDRERAGRSP